MELYFPFPGSSCPHGHAEDNNDDRWLAEIEDAQLLGIWFELRGDRFNDDHKLAIQNELYSRGIQAQL